LLLKVKKKPKEKRDVAVLADREGKMEEFNVRMISLCSGELEEVDSAREREQ
jgi:hypothetical protein